jgi:signal transduction histidine kinase
MIGVSTSIELAARTEARSQQHEYFERARQSLQFMRRLLAQVADATSLEVALTTQEVEPVSISELASGRAQDLRLAAAGWQIDAQIEPGIWVHGNADSLVQMLDKLIDNALDHGDRHHPLRIELTRDDRDARLVVEDRGEALPRDIEALFQPFMSNKSRHTGSVNLGLGLLVARAIAAQHGGSVEARALHDPPGAAFIVRIPAQPAPTTRASASEPAIPAAALGCDTVE